MSLQTRIQDLAVRIASEFKTVKTIITGNNAGTLTSLTTTAKTNIIEAINELVTRVNSKENTITKGNLTGKSSEIELTGSGTGSIIGNNVEIGLSTSVKADIAKGVTADAYRLIGHVPLSQKGVANGVATLGSDGKLPNNQIPALAITNTFPVASQTAMLALTAEPGDVAIRSDISKSFILRESPASTLANWNELLNPGAPVASVNGKVGVVTLVKADVGLGNVDNTSDASKPVSTAQAAAIGLKANSTDVYTKTELGNPETNLVTIFENALV